MIKEKLVPNKRFEGFTDSWDVSDLHEFKFYISDGNYGELYPRADEFIKTGIPFLRVNNLKNGYLTNKDLVYISPVLHSKLLSGHLMERDVLITTRGQIGKIAYVDKKFEGANINAQICLIRTENKMSPEYLHQFLQTEDSQRQIISLQSGSALKQLPRHRLNKVSIKYPLSKTEQEKIGSFFKKIDEMIQLQQSKVNKIKDIKSAYLSEMFPKEGEKYPKKRFEGFTEPWNERSLSDLGDIITGTTPSTKNETYYSENGIPWVTPTDIYKNITYKSKRHLSKAGQQVSKVVPKNTILVTSIASIGKNTILGRAGSFNQQINALVPNRNLCSPYFLFIQSFFWSEKMKQTAASGTMQIVNKTEFSKITTKVPVLEEQEKIGQFFKNLDNQISIEEEKLAKLKKLKQAYLNDMFV
ncbi:restriction endonuclease subunit S [Facklamia sp. 7083-14-GEN3]|uniref:restriction endonuclease subunit S n=1 Tax=Facklamia sp. 7083-14-GEN3 TaxID=2973478 RepID=UPI00215CDD69|nr:restriction endonuclease subunit S [Facklamia sp. 7083-14-GEN3]MCR8969087.1 restriction endonuclease subunit S [Facklamia sp. 7083-14-GEN3]